VIIFFSFYGSKQMADLACQQPFPGSINCTPPGPSIWVKRWELKWVLAAANACDATTATGCSWHQVATCNWYAGEVILPAVPDWPRWKNTGTNGLPPDEYYRLTYVAQYTCPDTTIETYNKCLNGCGLTLKWSPVFTKIETPRAWRYVTTAEASAMPT